MGLSLRQRLFVISAIALFPALGILVFNEVQLRQERAAEVNAAALRQGRLASLELGRILDGVSGVMLTASSASQIQNADISACDAFLAGIVDKFPTLTALSVVDAGGTRICSSGADAPSAEWARDPSLAAASDTDIAIGTYQVSAGGKRVLPVSLALTDQQRRPKGVLIGTIGLDWLGAQLKERGLTNGGQLTLADRNGVILTRDPLPERFVGTRIPPAFMHLVNADQPGTLDVLSQDGTERIIGYYPTTMAPARGIYLSTGIAKAEAFAPINRATSFAVVLIVAGALAAFLLTWLVGRVALQEPVDRILSTTAAWRRGDLSIRTGFKAQGNELRAIGAALDEMMDDLRARTELNTLLSREMAHRVKNTLAVVQVLANQTFAGREMAKEKSAFGERLRGLAASHDLLLAGGWHGGDLRRCLETALEPYRSGARQIRLAGDVIELEPSAVLAVSMIVHELATNAVKYGAFNSETGGIDIGWSRLGDRVSIVWQEHGGPPVAVPSTQGFGTRLIHRAFPAGLDPNIELRYLPDGLRCLMSFKHAAEAAATPAVA